MVNEPLPHDTDQKPAGEVAYMNTTSEVAVAVASVTVLVFPVVAQVVAVAAELPVSTRSRCVLGFP
jgi:hypothetical protein